MTIGEVLKTGGILYKVDPRRLSVEECDFSSSKLRGCTTYEDFSLEENNGPEIPANQASFMMNGIMYFKNKFDAFVYLRNQCGFI